MNIITHDYETHWAADYTLSKMSPLEYVMDPRFQLISCTIKVNDQPTVCHFGEANIRAAFARQDIANSALLAHNNSGFDSYITAYKLGLKPKTWLCTLAMARPIHAKTTGLSLARLVAHYGLGTKNNAILLSTKGKRLEDFTPSELADMATYNIEDTDQCWELFKILRAETDSQELWQIDMTTRMRTEPAFVLDRELLERAAREEAQAKRESILKLAEMLGIDVLAKESAIAVFGADDVSNEDEVVEDVRAQLASASKFSEILVRRGVAVPMKPSPTNPDKEVPALAKTDQGFIDLQEHDDEIVACAARTRLQVKSTLLETRIGKLLTAARLAGGKLPVPIRYYGADTTGRDSGEEYNMLNLPRVNPKSPKRSDALRMSLKAPPGHKIIVADQSNIELRINHTLWKVKSSMDLWKRSPTADLYRADAAITHNCKPEEVTFDQRQLAKIKQLGLGFGAAAETFRQVAKNPPYNVDLSVQYRYATVEELAGLEARGNLGTVRADDQGFGMLFDRDPAAEAVQDWRMRYQSIVRGWYRCNDAIEYILAGRVMNIDPWDHCATCPEGIILPDKRIIRYPELRREADKKTGREEWVYGRGQHKARIYGGKVVENIVQALARTTIAGYTMDFFKATGRRPAVRPYDELVYVVPEDEAEALLALLQSIMRTPPAWWPNLVVWSEGGISDTYGTAK
jgi:hypothetical protein